MRFIYPAIINQEEDGSWKASMPDLEGCTASGYSFDDVMEEINAAAREWIAVELDDDGMLPPVSDAEDLKALLPEGSFIRNVCITWRIMEGWDE